MGRSTRDAVCPISTRRFASAYGSGLSKTPFTRAKTAAVAPMPRASVRTTGTENPGCRTRQRSAWRATNSESLLISQRHHRIDPRRPARGEITRNQRNNRKQCHDAYERRGIARPDSVQERREQPSDGQGDQDADPDPHSRQPNPIAHDLRHHVSAARPEREPDPELAPPLPDGVRQEAVDADGGEQQRGSGEAAQQPGVELPRLEPRSDIDRCCRRSATNNPHRNVWIDLTDGPAQRREERRRSHSCPDDETHMPPDVPGEGNVDLRLGRRGKAKVVDIAHHAHDGAGHRLTEIGASLHRFVKRQWTTERIDLLARPECPHECFVHYTAVPAPRSVPVNSRPLRTGIRSVRK